MEAAFLLFSVVFFLPSSFLGFLRTFRGCSAFFGCRAFAAARAFSLFPPSGGRLDRRLTVFIAHFSPRFHRRLGCFYRRLGCFYRHIVWFLLAYLGFFLYLCSIVIKLVVCLILIFIKMISSRQWMNCSRVCRVPFSGLVLALFWIARFLSIYYSNLVFTSLCCIYGFGIVFI